MKRFLALLLCIYTFHEVESYTVEIVSIKSDPRPGISISTTGRGIEGIKRSLQFETVISEPIDTENDFEFFYNIYDENHERIFALNARAKLCSANYFSDLRGSVSALLAQCWGIMSGSACPANESSYISESPFKVDNLVFGDFAPKDSGYRILEISNLEKRSLLILYIYDDNTWERDYSDKTYGK